MASEFLSDEELNEVSGGIRSEDGKYLYVFEAGDWVYAREDKTVIHRVIKSAHTNSSVYLVSVEVNQHGAQPTYGRVPARKLVQFFHQFGGNMKNY